MRVLNAIAVGLATLVALPCATLAQSAPQRRRELVGIVRDYDDDGTGVAAAAVPYEPRIRLITTYDAAEPVVASDAPEAILAPVTLAADYDDPRNTITIAMGRPYTLALITRYDSGDPTAREEYLPRLAIIHDYSAGNGLLGGRASARPFEIVIDSDDVVRTTLPAVIIAR